MTDTPSTTDESALKRKAYDAGMRRLRENHVDEFWQLVDEEAAELGIEYRRRLTAEERAEQQARELLAAHPGLLEKITGQGPVPTA